MPYTTCTVPTGEKISISSGKLHVPNNPIIPFIRGDGTGPDIWASSVRVLDAAAAGQEGDSKIQVEVFWPSGLSQRWNLANLDQEWLLVEGQSSE